MKLLFSLLPCLWNLNHTVFGCKGWHYLSFLTFRVKKFDMILILTTITFLECSRKRFSEKQAEQWWAENRARVYERYNVRMVDKSSVAVGSEDFMHWHVEMLIHTQTLYVCVRRAWGWGVIFLLFIGKGFHSSFRMAFISWRFTEAMSIYIQCNRSGGGFGCVFFSFFFSLILHFHFSPLYAFCGSIKGENVNFLVGLCWLLFKAAFL